MIRLEADISPNVLSVKPSDKQFVQIANEVAGFRTAIVLAGKGRFGGRDLMPTEGWDWGRKKTVRFQKEGRETPKAVVDLYINLCFFTYINLSMAMRKVMTRTKGSKNRTPEQIRLDAQILAKKAEVKALEAQRRAEDEKLRAARLEEKR